MSKFFRLYSNYFSILTFFKPSSSLFKSFLPISWNYFNYNFYCDGGPVTNILSNYSNSDFEIAIFTKAKNIHVEHLLKKWPKNLNGKYILKK